MHKRIALSAAALVAALPLATGFVAQAAASAPAVAGGPNDTIIEVTAVAGSGCAHDRVGAAMAADSEAFNISYLGFTARTGGSSKPDEGRRNCLLAMKVTTRQNLTYAIAGTAYRLSPDLRAGAKATLESGYDFHRGAPIEKSTFNVSGPANHTFQFTDKVPVTKLVYKPCGEDRILKIETELRVANESSDRSKVDSISLDHANGTIKQTYQLAWRRCP
ncbi:DUF4360 domain-containing protein [Actinomadura litoris]|uniref:DUF4360 domain-containing protein n=1 Tax=Actinomadura litoris TaxID=2678616 RepID=UPI001FA6CA39|nr:DUF4360 domain-containing protein [Actinomadura litoris]